METIKKLTTSTFIPIGSLVIIVGAIWFLAQVSYQVRINTDDIKKVEFKIDDLPTRTEIQSMQEDIKEIKNFLLK